MSRTKIFPALTMTALAVVLAGCTSLMFWRKPAVLGQASLVDQGGLPLAGQAPQGISVNFINLDGTLTESIPSVETDALGKFRSPDLAKGRYKVEAMLPGFTIESVTLLVKSHEHKRASFVLRRISEAEGRSLRESQEENIPNPGEVKITPPSR